MKKPFHVVHIRRNGRHVNYEIYCNNEPFLVPAKGVKLAKSRAYDIANLLNIGMEIGHIYTYPLL